MLCCILAARLLVCASSEGTWPLVSIMYLAALDLGAGRPEACTTAWLVDDVLMQDLRYDLVVAERVVRDDMAWLA